MTAFHRNFFNQALTAATQSALFSSLVFVDIYLTGQLDEVSVAATGLAGRTFWLVSMVLFGIASGAGVFFAQYWGKKDLQGFRNVFQVSLFINLLVAVPAALIFMLVPEWLMSFATENAQVAKLAGQYLRIVSFSLIAAAIFMAVDYLFRAINQPRLPLLAGVLEVALNIALSSILVFGLFGAPELGMLGAAWGSVLARGARAALLLLLLAREHEVKVYGINWLRLPAIASMQSYLNMALPLMFNAAIWAVGIYIYSLIFAQISVEALTIWNTLIPIQGFLMAWLSGIAQASGVVVGQSLGANEYDEAVYRARFSAITAVVVALVLAVLVYCLRGFYGEIFTGLSNELQQQSSEVLLILVCLMPSNALSLVFLVGVFRAGGATKFNLVIDVITSWLIAIPLALLAAFYWQLSVFWVIAILLSSELVKTSTCLWFYQSKRWVKALV